MNVAIIISVLIGSAVILGLVLVLRDVARGESALPLTAEWINELSVDRYRPMMRLLDHGEIEFLRSQPGYTPKLESRVRAQRCQVFRDYLRCLNTDFQRISTALKILMTQSDHDRPDLAAIVMQHQFQFATGMLAVRGRLFLFQMGIGRVDAASLLKVFDVMRIELGSMVPAAQGSCA